MFKVIVPLSAALENISEIPESDLYFVNHMFTAAPKVQCDQKVK